MKVYIVTVLVDTEYGNRATYEVYDSKEKAQKFIDEHQEVVKCWYGDDIEYDLEVWKVK